MKNIEINKKLKKFLKKHKAWEKFKINVKAYMSDGVYYNITSLEHSFMWVATYEGQVYWEELSRLYNETQNG